jgi:hypothetical protein
MDEVPGHSTYPDEHHQVIGLYPKRRQAGPGHGAALGGRFRYSA